MPESRVSSFTAEVLNSGGVSSARVSSFTQEAFVAQKTQAETDAFLEGLNQPVATYMGVNGLKSFTAASTSNFFGLASDAFGAVGSWAESDIQSRVTSAGTLSGFEVNYSNVSRTTATTVTLRRNGVDTGAVITIPATVTRATLRVPASIAVSNGDLISARVTTGTGTGTLTILEIKTSFIAGNGKRIYQIGAVQENNFDLTGANGLINLGGEYDGVTTDPSGNFTSRTPGKVRGLRIVVTANTSTVDFTFTVNGVTGGPSIVVPAGTTGVFYSATEGTFPVGTNLKYSFTAPAGTRALRVARFGIELEFDGLAYSEQAYSDFYGTTNFDTAAGFVPMNGTIQKATVEGHVVKTMTTFGSVIGFSVIQGGIGSGRTVTLRKNGQNTGIALTTSTNSTTRATGNVSFVPGDRLSLAVTSGATSYGIEGVQVDYVPAVGNSYSNPGGSGQRRFGAIAMTRSADLSVTGGSIYNLIGGTEANDAFFANQTVASKWIEFDFGEARFIDEARWIQDSTATHGVWRWQGSNDNGGSWTAIGADFTLGGALTQIQSSLSANGIAYRKYRLFGVSGSASNAPYLREIQFRIDAGGPGEANYQNPISVGDRTSLVSVTGSTSPTAFQNVANFSLTVGGTRPALLTNFPYFVNQTGDASITFDLGSSKHVRGGLFWTDVVNVRLATVKWQGSNNLSSWADLTSFFDLTAPTVVGESGSEGDYRLDLASLLSGNVSAYRYLRLLKENGSSASATPFIGSFAFQAFDGPASPEITGTLTSAGVGAFNPVARTIRRATLTIAGVGAFNPEYTAPSVIIDALTGELLIDGGTPTLRVDEFVFPLAGDLVVTGGTPTIPVVLTALTGSLKITGRTPLIFAGTIILTTTPGALVIEGGQPAVFGVRGAFVTQQAALTLGRVIPSAGVTQMASLTLASVIPAMRATQFATLTLGRVIPPMTLSQVAQLTLVKRVIQPSILPEPEVGVGEVWEWRTDIQIADDGTEQRIALRDFPRRSFSGEIIFDDEELIKRQVQFMLDRFGDSFVVPLYQYRRKLLVKPLPGEQWVYFDTSKMDISEKDYAYIYTSYKGFQLAKVLTIEPDRLRLDMPILKDYGDGLIWIMPCAVCMAPNNTSFDRGNADYMGSLDMRAIEIKLHRPFIRETNTQTLEMFGGLPVLNIRPIGTDFDNAHDMGLNPIDYGDGKITLRNKWKNGQNQFNREFMLHRERKPADYDRWKVFADYCKGSQKPFLLPSFRADFDIIVPAAADAQIITVDGLKYGPTFFGREAFRRIAISSNGGVHYAVVWAAAQTGSGDTVLYFQPEYPTGAAWQQNQKVSFLMQVRIADDRVSFEHNQLQSTVSLSIRTVDDARIEE